MRLYSAKETYNFKEPTNRSLPISERQYLLIARHRSYVDDFFFFCETQFTAMRIFRSLQDTMHMGMIGAYEPKHNSCVDDWIVRDTILSYVYA